MSDVIRGIAVLKPGRLYVMCYPAAGPRAGSPFGQSIPAYQIGDPKLVQPSWQYAIVTPATDKPGRLDVSPSLKVQIAKWDEGKQAFGTELEEIFHNGGQWSVDYVDAPDDGSAYELLLKLNPEVPS